MKTRFQVQLLFTLDGAVTEAALQVAILRAVATKEFGMSGIVTVQQVTDVGEAPSLGAADLVPPGATGPDGRPDGPP
jgi:hypothetical protein